MLQVKLAATIGVTVGVSLLATAGAAHACGPEAYLTPEQIASGLYDLTPPPYSDAAPHSHDVAPSSAPSQPAPAAPTAPEASTAPAEPPAEGPTAPSVSEPSVQSGAEQPTSGARPEEPAATHRHSDGRLHVHAPAAARQPAAHSPAGAPGASTPATPAEVLADSAAGARIRFAAPARRSGRAVADAIESATRVERPLAGAPSATDGVAPAPRESLIAAIAIALAAAAGLALAIAVRWRRGSAGAPARMAGPTPALPPDEVEVALQEMLAEERANRLLSGPRAPV